MSPNEMVSPSVTEIKWNVQADGRGYFAVVDYGISDEKGRKIGGTVVVNKPWSYTDSYSGAVRSEKRWEVMLYTTRNGEKFGAIPRSTYFETEAEAIKAAEKKPAEAQKRFKKKFPKETA